MKKSISVLIFVFVFNCLYAQTKTGVVYYGEVQSLGMGAPIGKDYSAMLLFDLDRSLYVTRKDSLEQLSLDGKGAKDDNMAISTNEEGFQYYNDKKAHTFYARDLGFKYVKEALPEIKWNIKSSTKVIGDFECQMATCNFRGREYTAWFTKQIPLPYGPWKLQGLPGLILEAYDTYKEIYWYFKEMKYPSVYSCLLKPISNPSGEWITFDEFDKFMVGKIQQSVINGRIAAEKMGITVYEPKVSDHYIEVFGTLNLQ